MDDDLFLNISTEAAPVAKQKSKIVGGKWRDRRNEQLKAKGQTRKTKSNANETPLGERKVTTEIKDTKKVEKKRPAENDSKGPSKHARLAEGKGAAGKNNTYVSSLFTSKPELTSRDYNNKIEEQEPSNAPLSDSTTFIGLGINEKLSKQLTEFKKLSNPTKIQRSVIPRLLTRNRDLLVQAQTGSGKTLSFALPIFQKLMEISNFNRTSGIFALILTPTRELATQIYTVLEELSRCCNRIVPGIVIGGEKKKAEKARLRKGVNILVATPGRLSDHIENTERLDLSNIRYVVLDEGDKLMELGFEETITKIIKDVETTSKINETKNKYPTLPFKRVNILCSATIKGNVQKLGEIALNDPEMVNSNSVPDVESLEIMENIAAPDQLLQQVVIVPPKLRLVTLASILLKITSNDEPSRTMIFLSCSDSVDFHFKVFSKDGKKYDSKTDTYEPSDENSTALTSSLLKDTTIFKLHGSLSQPIRTATLSSFTKQKKSKHTIMFCTDVAARGLDLPYISTVIEYDPPFATEDHLHRIGRTARAGKSGRSVLFLLPTEEKYLDKIKKFHPNGLQHKSYEELLKTGFGENWDFDATTWHLNVERWILEDSAARDLAARSFTSHIRAYATHLSQERDCFNVKALHLGHLAKAFALRETPKKLGIDANNNGTKRKKENPKDKMFRVARMTAKAASDEFNFM